MVLGECQMPGCDAPASLGYEFNLTVWDSDGNHLGVFQRWSCAKGCHWDQEAV